MSNMKQIKRLEININTSSTLKKILTICLSALGTFGAAQAQIQVTQSATTAEVRSLVENVLLGSCVTVSNVNYIGPANAAGTFNAANTSFTMQNGILLTTGRAGLAVGPDNDNDAGLDQARVGDANLTTLAGVTTYDAVVLEFDFVPQDDTLRFNYVFGSEEYPEWVNSQYNDVFGFFISGPGINGPYVGNAANIALIPNTNIPVAINNVNNGYSATEPANGPCDNCAYYVENANGSAVQYDGYTKVLTAQAVVTPCQTYHIRLAIGDAGDHIYDSGVFLQAGSFSSGGGITVDFSDLAIEEGCSNEYIVFRRVNLSDNSTAIAATYSLSGTATAGLDYNTFPTTVVIPAGQDSVIIPIVIPLDFMVEGIETIIVSMDQPPCDCLAPGSATINILDNDVPLALTTTGTTTICLGQSANLTASVSGSLPPYTGSWNNGAPAGANVTVSPTTTTTYTYTVTDACNSQTRTSSQTVTVIRPDFTTNDATQCLDGNALNFTNTGASGGTVSHYWTFGDGNTSINENPSHAYGAAGNYTVTHYVIFTASACTTNASAAVTIFPEPNISVSVDQQVICANGTNGALSTSVSGGTAGFGYSWNPGGQTTPNLSGLGIGTYTVSVTDANGCTDSDQDIIVQSDPIPPTVSCPATANITTDAGLCTSSASIGTATSSDNCGVQSTVVSNAGPYSVGTTTVTWTATDASGNTATCGQDVVVSDDEDPTITGCPQTISITPASSDCTPEVTWNIPSATDNCSGTLTSNFNSGDSFPIGTTTVTYTATDLSGNSVTCSFDVIITPSQLSVSITPSTLGCGVNISCFGAADGEATANVSGGCLPYAYSWSNGQTGATATGLTAGTYSVIVTDANGIPEIAYITLTEPSELIIDDSTISEFVGGNNVSCNGANDGSIELDLTGGSTCQAYNISWTGPNGFTSSSEDVTGLTAGVYTVSVQDVNGCTVTETFTLNEPDALIPTCTSTDALCNGDANGGAEVSVSGGSAPFSYSWTNGELGASITSLTAGTYGVTVTDANGCSVSCSSVVGQPEILTAVVVAQDETLVNGCNGSATANPSGGTAPYSYSWANGQSTQTATNLCAGIHSVTIIDANGCAFTTSVVINPPTCDLDVDVSGTDANCNGASDGTVTATPITVQNNTPFSYLWNNGATTQTVTGLPAGPYTLVVTDSIGCQASGSVVVSEPTLLSVGTTVVDELTFNGCDGSASVIPTGGTPPYDYNWSDGQTTQTASSLCPGVYSVTVTDANGCSETVTLTVNPLLCTGFSVAMNTQRLSCFQAGDGSATAVVTGGTAPFSYSWSNGGTGSSISGLSAGTYTVTVVDAVNCSQTISGNVTQPALLQAATAVDNVTCHGTSNGVIELTVTGGTSPYNFNWSNGSTSEDLNNLGPGTYNVSITDANGCTTSSSGVVTQPDTLGASSVDVQVSCNGGNNGSIDLSPTGGLAPYLYSWSNGATSQDLSGLAAGTYTVTFADQNGCLLVYSTTISEPDQLTANCSSEDALCNGDANGSVEVTVNGGTAPYAYSWSNGSSSSSQSGLVAATYVVSVSDDNGCVVTCSSVIGEPNVLTAVVVVQDETLVNGCNGLATADPSGGTAPYSYSWSDGQTTQTAVNLCAGTYTVTITDANGCEFTTSNIVNPPSCDLDVDVTGTDVDCYDGSNGTVTATPLTVQNNTPFTYLWNTGATTQTVSDLIAGPYTVVITDSIGCEASGSVVISEPTALSVSTVVVDEETFNGCDGSATANATGGTAPYSYSWSDGQTTQTAGSLCPGVYTVTVTDANGCTETVTVTVNALLCTGFSVAINSQRLSCFEAGDGSATAVVIGGTAPFEYSWDNGGTTSTISNLSAGPYTVTVIDALNCSQTVSGNVTQPAILQAATAVDNVSCHGTENAVVELTVTGGTAPYQFAWDNGAITEDLNNVGPGTYNVNITDMNGCTTSSFGTVTEPDTLSVSSIDVNPTCFEGTDGSIDLSVSGGLAPYLYSWDNGANSADLSGLEDGSYTVTVVDQNGCVYVYSTTLTDPSQVVPTITASGPTVFCEGGSVMLTSSAAATYSWTPNGETTQSITVYDSGDYTVNVVDASGCAGTSATVSVSIFQVDTVIVVADGPLEFCQGERVGLTASEGDSYFWSPTGETSQSITVNTGGSYSVTVTDENGCTATSASVVVVVNPLPHADITPSGPTSFCEGGSVTLTSSVADSYLWVPNGETTQSITVTTAGSYGVSVVDANGCGNESQLVDVSVFVIPAIDISANGPTEFCDGGSVTLSSTAGSGFVWAPNGETSQSITVSTAGQYSVTLVDVNGCYASSDTITVVVNPNPTPTVSADGDRTFCEGGSVTLTSSLADAYLWSPNGETSQSILVNASGDYSVTVTDNNGCVGTSSATTVTVNPNPVPTINASGPTEFCQGGSVSLTSSSASSYSWSPNGEITQSITVSESGSYSVSVVDQNGCSGQSTTVVDVVVFEPDTVTITVSGATDFCEGGSVTLTSSLADAYLWSPTSENTQTITVTSSGSYSVTATDANGCTSVSASVDVTVFDDPNPVIAISGPTTFCEGDSVVLTAPASVAYLWFPDGETTQSITVSQSGSYSVQIGDVNLCVWSSDTVDVNVLEPAIVDVTANGPLTFCDGGSVTLTATGGGTYLWASNGQQTPSIVVNASGEYSVTVVDANGCSSDSDTITVTENDLPVVAVTITGPVEFCEGESTVLLANSTPVGIAYQWYDGGTVILGANGPTLSVDDASTYTVQVTDANGCSSTATAPTVSISPIPVAVIGPDMAVCPGDSVVLTASGGGNFLWSNGATTPSITVWPSSDTAYSVVVSTEFCDQTSSDTINITLLATPTALISTNANGVLEVAHLFSDGSGDVSIVDWAWDFGDGTFDDAQNPDHTFSDEDSFTVTLTVANQFGCTDTDTVVVTVRQVIDIPNVFTPNGDGYNDVLFIDNFGVVDYELTIYNRWGIVMHYDISGEIFWDGRTPAGKEAAAGTYYYTLIVKNEFSVGNLDLSGFITLIR